MDTETGQIEISPRLTQRSRWIAEQVIIVAEAFGQSMPPARLKIYVSSLVDLSDENLHVAFRRAVLELNFFPTVAEFRQLAGASRAALDAEARAAWDQAIQFTRKYVGNDPFGNYGPQHGSFRTYPQLSNRILDCVRRVGGWRALVRVTDDSLPFLRRAFLEEYAAAPAVENVDSRKLLQGLASDLPKHRQLPTCAEPKLTKASTARIVRPERRPARRPLSDAEWEERRRHLQEQAQELMARASVPSA